MSNFNTNQKMLAFAFLADVALGEEMLLGAAKSNHKRIKEALKATSFVKAMGNWELVYGPAIQVRSLAARNSTVIFKNNNMNTSDPSLVIGVAGTNFVSKFDWFTEDFDVTSLASWQEVMESLGSTATFANAGAISYGAHTALLNTWNTKSQQTLIDRKTPIQWLKKNLPNNMSAGDTVAITGHSLGGAISPVLAQALKDYQEAWNTNGISLNIAAYLFAGHTPGDTVYRDYVQSSLSKIESTVNLYDVVPHAWSLCPTSSPVCLEKIRSLYESVMPEIVNKEDAIVSTMCDWAIDKSKKATLDGSTASVNYSRWTNEIKLEGDLEKANPQVVEKLLSGLRFLKTVSHVKASLAVICDTNDENQIDNCLEYFSCFMVIMGGQHVAQYRIKVFKDDAFSNDLKAIFDLSKEFDELYGGIVLSKLFSLLANWKKAVTQNKGSR